METLNSLRYAIESYGYQRQRLGRGKGGHYAPSTMEMVDEDLRRSQDVLDDELAEVEGLILTAEEALGYDDANIARLQAEVTDYKAKAAQFKLAWQGQRDAMRNYEILLTAYQQPPAAALVRDLDGVTDGIQDEELWRAGVKLLRMALNGEK